MTTDRENLILSLHELPPVLQAVADVTFGSSTTLTTPTTVEDSLIVQGKVAVNFNNNVLVPLSGLPIVELALHIGQNSPTNMAMLLSMLKATGSMGKNTFQVSWEEGMVFTAGNIPPLRVTPSGGGVSAVSGELSGPKNLEFEFDKPEDADAWYAEPDPSEPGHYTLTVYVAFTDLDEPKNQSLGVSVIAPVAEGGA